MLLGAAASREAEKAGDAEDDAERQAEGAEDDNRIISPPGQALIAIAVDVGGWLLLILAARGAEAPNSPTFQSSVLFPSSWR